MSAASSPHLSFCGASVTTGRTGHIPVYLRNLPTTADGHAYQPSLSSTQYGRQVSSASAAASANRPFSVIEMRYRIFGEIRFTVASDRYGNFEPSPSMIREQSGSSRTR
jgi:hypothetical protein